MISNHALKKVRLSLSTWQLLLVSTRWQINLSPENKLLKQHNLGQFGCSSLVKKFGRNCLTYLINYQDSTKVWEIPQTLCVVGMTTYYGINFKNSKSVKIFQDMHCVGLLLRFQIHENYDHFRTCNIYMHAKGQLISKCLIGSIVSTKKPTKFF